MCRRPIDGHEVYFLNLKEFFDRMFAGSLYQGESMKALDFVTLRAPDGTDLRYENTYKAN